ncbi:MAG: FtsX-like permease family protein [Myxococcaceae bacterium]|nr:FtsX-like permease family protein [Myxococcaceae bacterium]
MALLKLAVRNLRRNRRRSTITLAAMIIGTVAMTCLRGFINGQQRVIIDNQVEGRMGAVQVHKRGYIANVLTSPLALDMADTPELRQKLAKIPGVVAVAPRIEFGAMLSTPDKKPQPDDGSLLPPADQGKTSFIMATAIDPQAEALVTPLRNSFIRGGKLFASVDAHDIVLNDDFARGLEVAVHPEGTPLPKVEQQLALLAPDRDGALNGENVVMGAALPSFSPGDRRIGLVPLGTAQRILRMEGRVTEYSLAVSPFDAAPRVRDAAQAALGPDFEVHTWSELMPFIGTLTNTQDFIFSVISGVFLAVVLLGIVNAMLMTVLERVREIGTMLAVGMRRVQIIQLFVMEGLVIGIVGGLLGIALGYLIVTLAGHIGIPLPAPGAAVPSVVKPFITPLYLVSALVGVPVGASLACLWPAWRASRLRPVEALQTA